MARTTGYTASIVSRMLKKELFSQKGVIPPEYLGQREPCVKFILDELKKRGVIYKHTVKTD